MRSDRTQTVRSPTEVEDGERGVLQTGAVGEPTIPPRDGVAGVIGAIASDLSLLVRQQVELAKQEMGAMARARARGVGALAAAAVLGLFVVAFLGLSAAAALDLALPRWASLLIVAAAFLVFAVIGVLLGRRWLRTPGSATARTKETLREDVEWAKRQLRR